VDGAVTEELPAMKRDLWNALLFGSLIGTAVLLAEFAVGAFR
jgi:hypothetical protein